MKNDMNTVPNRIETKVHLPDIVISEKIANENNAKMAERARPRRRINYVKKILNDDFLMGME